MPVKVPSSLPAVELLREENIFVMENQRAEQQDIRPLHIAIINLNSNIKKFKNSFT